MPNFEQENQQYESQVRNTTVIGAGFWILRLPGEPQGPREDIDTPQVSSNQLDLSHIFQNFFHQKN